MSHPSRRQRGFTLVELMVVVAIAAVLASIALPNYMESVRKSRRADARAALQELAQQLEAYYARNGTYTTDMTELGYPNARWNSVPRTARFNDRHYAVRILPPTRSCPIQSCYRLRAVPRRGGAQAKDDYKVFELRSNGRKFVRVGKKWRQGWGH